MEFNLPLELWLKKAATHQKSKFPVPDQNYFTFYCALKEKLNTHIYSAVNSALLKKYDAEDVDAPGVEIYTDHGLGHVNSVIRMAGNILGCKNHSSKISLEPYEVYLLLCCIVCHDAGNIHGRIGHELNIRRILNEPRIQTLNEEDITAIHQIAKTHTGKVLIGDRYTNDTIQTLQLSVKQLFQINYRPRVIAAVLRLSDEMSEDRLRVPVILLEDSRVRDGGSGIYLLYANTIINSSADREGRLLKIDYELKEDQILKIYNKFEANKENGKIVSFSQKDIYLLDEIINRLKKVNRERIYCNRYADGVFVFSKLIATLTILIYKDNGDIHEEKFSSIEMYDFGYPEEQNLLSNEFLSWSTENVSEKIKDRRRKL